jgi:hypothetical protein
LPQYADGRFTDGSYYRTTIVVHNSGTISTVPCTLQVYEVGPQQFTRSNGAVITPANNRVDFNVPDSRAEIFQSAGTGAIGTGHATVTCGGFAEDLNIFAVFTAYTAAGVKVGEATVFGAPDEFGVNATAKTLVVDLRGGAQVGVALANNETTGSRSGQYRITVRDLAGLFVGQAVITLPPRTHQAAFLSELPGITLPANFVGTATIVPTAGYAGPTPYALGLRYTGALFTTLPVGICDNTPLCGQ